MLYAHPANVCTKTGREGGVQTHRERERRAKIAGKTKENVGAVKFVKYNARCCRFA